MIPNTSWTVATDACQSRPWRAHETNFGARSCLAATPLYTTRTSSASSARTWQETPRRHNGRTLSEADSKFLQEPPWTWHRSRSLCVTRRCYTGNNRRLSCLLAVSNCKRFAAFLGVRSPVFSSCIFWSCIFSAPHEHTVHGLCTADMISTLTAIVVARWVVFSSVVLCVSP